MSVAIKMPYGLETTAKVFTKAISVINILTVTQVTCPFMITAEDR